MSWNGRVGPATFRPMSTFSLGEFYQKNRRVVIWAVLFGILWLMRDFFGLVFLTFFFGIIAAKLSSFAARRFKLPRAAALLLIYVTFLIVLASFIRFVVPSVALEVNRLIGNLPSIEARLIEVKNHTVARYPTLRQPLAGFLRSALPDDVAADIDSRLAEERARLSISDDLLADSLAYDSVPTPALEAYFNRQDQLYLNALTEQQFQRIRSHAPAVISMLYRATGTMLLALLFSFLILIDLRRLTRGIERLKTSKIGDFYDEAAPPIGRFGILVGRAIEAQASIALINTLLTTAGLLMLGVPMVAMLAVIVFVCSFVPVLGVFISTVPIVLVALNHGGLPLSGFALGMVVFIHAVEAYLLNPLIYGRHLKLNPVLTLIILYVAYHGFGLWGMLLGVPVARYVLHDVLGLPFREPARRRRRAPA